MIKAVIIDDEKHSVETLIWKLENFCPEVAIMASFTNPLKGLEFLRQQQPDILFLDIEMPRLNGFDVLEELQEVSYDIIFITAYDEFAIKAIKFSALDYLLKPVQNSELKQAIEKHKKKDHPNVSSSQLEILFSNVKEEQKGTGKIALATKEKIEFVLPEEIIACSSDSNYTLVYLSNGRKKLISKTLKEFEEMLDGLNFFRIHHSHLINMRHIKEYIRSDGGYLVMTNEMSLPVSRSKKEELLKLF